MRVEPIDLRPSRDGSVADRQRVAEQFDHAARTSGFLSITGHGVDPDLCAEMLDVTAQYFDLPAADNTTELRRVKGLKVENWRESITPPPAPRACPTTSGRGSRNRSR